MINSHESDKIDQEMIFDNVHESIITTDTEGYITSWNKESERLFGYASDEAVGQHIEICHERSRDAVAQDFIEPLQRDGHAEIFAKLIRKSGETFDGHMLATLLTAPDGAVIGMIGYTLDITEKRRTEEALRDREEALSSVLEQSYDGLVTLEPIRDEVGTVVDFIYTSANPTAIKALGIDLTGRKLLETYPTSPEAGMFHQYIEAVETGHPIRTERHYAGMIDGDPWLQVVVVRTGHGLTVGINDISDRKLSEAKLKKNEFLLSEAERIAHLGTWDWDNVNNTLWWSDETFRIFGYDPGSFVPSTEKLIEAVHPDDRAYAEDQIRQCVVENKNVSYEHRIIHPDGSVRHVHEQGELFFDEQGVLVRTTGTVLDITDRKQNENELQRARDEMAQRVVERTEQVIQQSEIIDQVNDAVISANQYGIIRSWNKGAERMFGYVPGDLVGRTISALYAEDKRLELEREIAGVLESKGTIDFDAPMKRKDGNTFSGQVSLTVAPGRDGEPNVIIGYIRDITERKLAQDALAESERNLRSLTDHAPIGIFRGDSQGQLTYVNDRWPVLLGLSRDKAEGDGWVDAVHPDDRDAVVTKWQNFIDTGEPYENELRMVRSDGTVIWVYSQAALEFDEKGVFLGYVGSITDVTERKIAQDALVESEEKFRAITENSSDIIVIFNSEGHYTYISPATVRLLGYKRDEFIGGQPSKFIHPDDQRQFDRIMEKAVQNPGTTHRAGQVRAVSIEGNVHYFELMITNLPNTPGVTGTIVHARDITERVGIEKRLRNRENQLNTLVQLSPSGMYQSDTSGNVTFVNPRWSEIFGVTERDARHQGWVSVVHPEDRETTVANWRRSVAMQEPYNGEFRICKPDGDIVWIESQATLETGVNGEPLGYVGMALDITERKTAEQNITSVRKRADELQSRLNDAIESFSDGFALFDADDRVVMCNSAFRKDSEGFAEYLEPGTLFEDLVRGMYASSFVMADVYENEEAIQKRLDYHRNPENGFYTGQISNGNWVLIKEYRTHEGGTALIRSDITERVNAERALAEREGELRTLTNLSPVGIYRCSTSGQITYINDRWREIMGITGNTALDEGWIEALLPEDREPTINAWQTYVSGREEKYFVECRIKRADSGTAHLISQVNREYDDTGELLGFIGTLTEVTDLKETQTALNQSEERLSLALRGANDGLWDWNLETQEFYYSPRWAEMLGFQKDELPNNSEAWKLISHPDDHEKLEQYVDFCIAANGKNCDVEHRMRDKDGNYVDVLSRGFCLYDQAGKPVRMIGTNMEITDRKLAEKDLITAKELAEAANKAKSQFLSSMSHELRTPMNAILGFGQLLDQDKVEPLVGTHKEFVNEILRAGHLMMELINDVLDLEKIESGQIPLHIKESPLEPLLEGCLTMISANARAKDIELVTEFSIKELPPVRVDETRFRQVLLNLLSNAVKYNSPEGRVILNCETMDDGMVRISVTDTGHGIPADQKDLVFEPFQRLGSENSSTPGTGIGLTIARQLTESMGGVLDFESTVDEGSTFWIELPSASRQLH